MNKLFNLFSCIFIGLLLISARVEAVVVATTSLTKSCKSLVNTNLKIEEPSLQGLDERTFRRVSKAQEKMAENLYDEGIGMLESLMSKVDESRNPGNDYKRAYFSQLIAYAYSMKGDSDQSYPHFKNALKYGETSLPHAAVQQLRENVASFMYGQGEKKQALKLMQDWIKKSNVEKASVYYLLAGLYIDEDINKWQDAVCPAYFATKSADKPNKAYMQLLFMIHHELKDVTGSATVLKMMTEYFPEEKLFWEQLSSVYYQLNKIPESLAVLDMLYLRGKFNKESDFMQLSSLLSYLEVPFRSAQILEEGIVKGIVKAEDKNWRNVARNYHASFALEKAIFAYGKSAEISGDGKDYFKQGELLSDKEQWQKAINAFDEALSKGKLEDTGQVYLRKAVALVNLGSCDAGLKVLEQAAKYKKYKNTASGWTTYTQERIRLNKC